ncbi:MAG: EF-hand domain-containing protein [Vicinamibacterales bacterium]
MSTTPISSSTSGLSLEGLIKQLVDKVDTNKDGQISSNEFGTFLTSLLGAADGQSGQGSATSMLTRAVNAADGATASEADPSTWTSNNAPYGVTYAGFSPQDHRDLTLADLGVPGKAEKYAAYSYMVANKIQPTGDWAQGVADALNAKYNTTVFKAIDGETLGYGNEYIHSAANGYGMAAGTYDRSATGEFFWGWV